MFDENQDNQPEDIFAPVDGGVPGKKSPVPPPVAPARPAGSVKAVRPETEHEQILKNLEAGGDLTDFNQPPASSFLKRILVTVVVLAILALGVWEGWNYWQARSGAVDYVTKTKTPVANGLPNTDETDSSTPPSSSPTSSSGSDSGVRSESLKDTDGDGLKDADEEIIGTDIKKPDTDSDGLSDRDEVEIYETNPVNPDTDKDGVLDGAEVRRGDDPNGAGRLLELPVIE